MKRVGLLICISLFIVGCGSQKKIASTSKKEKVEIKNEDSNNDVEEIVVIDPNKPVDIKQQYIDAYSKIAMEEMQRYKIPASITLAQGILESLSGTSSLSKRSNNHFGIKCHKGWKGKRTYHDDDKKGECFRVYKHPSYSYRDHSLFLAERKRYMDLFRLKITNYKGWARGLRKAGYATDKKYPSKLIKIIEDYQLYKYDAMTLGKTVDEINAEKVDYHIVEKGDTLYSISRKYGVSINDLKQINGFDDNIISIGQKLYLTKLN